MKIAYHEGIYLNIPENAWYSFFNSPYIGHRNGTAVDVYFSDEPLLPTESGKVVEIRKVRAPKNLPQEKDYLIAIKIAGNTCLKILHVLPSVKVGDKLDSGDYLGKMIISGFFMPWSSKHAHFELRSCSDRIRARGGFLLTPIIHKKVPVTMKNIFTVIEKEEHFYWLSPKKTSNRGMTPFGTAHSSVEGGIPHYRYGAILEYAEYVQMFGRTFQIEHRIRGAGIFSTDFKLQAGSQKITGIGVFCNQQRIKLIGGDFEEGEEIEIKLI